MKCKFCHKEIHVKYPSHLKNRVYCSVKCQHAGFSKFYKHSKAQKTKIGLKSKGRQTFLNKHHTTNTKMIISIAAKKRLKDKTTHPFYGKHHTEKTKQKIRQTEIGKAVSDKTRKRNSLHMLKVWQDPNFVRKQMKASHVKQNKAEKKLDNILQQLIPAEYKFVGDGEFILAGKCPDFLNVNGQKKLIELYGDYWHRNDNPQDRIDYFKPYGYSTLVIWEHELKDEKSLSNKITNFNYE